MTASTLQVAADMAGATDLFVLSGVDTGQFVHIDGVGRGEGWAGNIQVSAQHEPHLAFGMARLHRVDAEQPVRIFGPYWNERAVIVPAGDYVVVVGGCQVSEDDQVLFKAAAEAAWAVGDIPASKRLADQLELTQAVLSVAQVDRSTMATAAVGLATKAADALGCEFGAVLLADGTLHLGQTPWVPRASMEEIADAIRQIPIGSRDGLLVEDDLHDSPWARRPLSAEDGLVTRCAVGLGTAGELGTLIVAHHDTTPRGFTSLCQRVATQVAEAGGDLLADVLSRN